MPPPSAPPARKRSRCTHKACRKLAPAGRKRCDEHKPGSGNPAKRPPRCTILGHAEARWHTSPLRPLNRKTTRGYEVIDFAAMIGESLLPWQERALIRGLETLPDGSLRFKTVVILVARQNGKSTLGRVLTLWRMYITGARRVLGTGQDVSLARDQMHAVRDIIRDCPDLDAEWDGESRAAGNEWIQAAACRYIIKALNRRAGRGGSNDLVIIDELRTQTDWDGWSAVSKTTMARHDGQVWCFSNAGDDTSVVLNQLSDSARSGRDESICLLEYSAPDDCELDDEDAWAAANPGLGYIIQPSAIRSSMLSDPPGVFRTEVLCQRVDQLDSAIDMTAWKACLDSSGTMDALRGRISACFDVALDGRHCALVVAGKLADGTIRIEAAGAWDSTETAHRELPGLLGRIKPAAFSWFSSGPGAALAPLLRALARRYNKRGTRRDPADVPEDGELTGARVTEACQALADAVKGRRILQPGDRLIDAHVGAATKLRTGDGWRFTRRAGPRESAGHVDGAYAVAGAVYVAATMPEPRRPKARAFSY